MSSPSSSSSYPIKSAQQIKDSFTAFADGEKKRITRESLRRWCYQHHVSPVHIDQFIKKFDENKDEEIDMGEFVRYYMREEIQEAFSSYDMDGDGKITRKEILTTLKKMGVKSIDALSHTFSMMADADDNSDGMITYSEFADHFVKTNYSFDLDDGTDNRSSSGTR